MSTYKDLDSILKKMAASASPDLAAYFFKTGKGHYAEHDKFAGIKVPELRKLAKQFSQLSLDDIKRLLKSPLMKSVCVGCL
jgi:hypothetical protein